MRMAAKNRNDFVKTKFREFYEEHSQSIRAPPEFEKREYGFIIFEHNAMVRHKKFDTERALQEFIREIVPAHAYNSTAYYKKPAEEMERKVWLGADLTFDVDADHIATPCKVEHDIWTCRDCGLERRGEAPDKCPKCASDRIEEQVWLCDVCLNKAKKEVAKLLDFLIEDFGFLEGEVKTCFSGHRGYHVHVRSPIAKQLNSDERKEIVDYVQGAGIIPRLHGIGVPLRGTRFTIPNSSERGWTGRLVRGLREVANDYSLEELTYAGLERKTASIIMKNREIVSSVMSGNSARTRRVGPGVWEKLSQAAITVKSATVDTVVTTDIHRLIRIPETLNGKTGFRTVEIEQIEKFDPFVDATAFKGEESIYVTRAPKFRVGNETFGPYKNQKVTISTPAAILLVCKGRATATDV